MIIKNVERFSIAVSDIDEATNFFNKIFDVHISGKKVVEKYKYVYREIQIGGTTIEILAPTSQDSIISKFIEKRGEGIYHVTLSIENLGTAIDFLKKNNIETAGPESFDPIDPLGDIVAWSEIYLNPKQTFGILFALAEIVHK